VSCNYGTAGKRKQDGYKRLTGIFSAHWFKWSSDSHSVAVLVGYFRLGEAVHVFRLIGAAMILGGLIGMNALL